ncbi:phytanoyl-CoA dioxygenase family protein [Pseudoalteromonas xiamenensis]|uniref:phytanoyl-CoA dioxygenase family protein n=1 Tax=Pseudoalteromonas xiamenensis TaxID=882626 RepID=UPI0027E52483|nr:phytanoyl-CoA dioxygenase family protein [Pseudoalteromonas xiamenensis]WMN61175.1 phytanoyl-CoA dioxygenase family protein [Pseudoalteromonas xiamenensis]
MLNISSFKNSYSVFATGLSFYSLLHPIKKVKGYTSLYNDGFYVIEDLFSQKQCEELIELFDNFEPSCAVSYGSDKRIFGLDLVSNIHRDLVGGNQKAYEIGTSYIGSDLELVTTLGGKVKRDPENLGSGGWHRDSFLSQFKMIVYLTDVDEDNGPFQYVNGSNLLRGKLKDASCRDKGDIRNPRYKDEYVRMLVNKKGFDLTTFTGKAGTAILCDTSGIHRGTPVVNGTRYAVTNYYKSKSSLWKRDGDGIIDKLAQETAVKANKQKSNND